MLFITCPLFEKFLTHPATIFPKVRRAQPDIFSHVSHPENTNSRFFNEMRFCPLWHQSSFIENFNRSHTLSLTHSHTQSHTNHRNH